MRASKYRPSGSEVLAAFPEPANERDVPLSIGAVMMSVAHGKGIRVRSVATVHEKVSYTATRELLDNMVLAGRLNVHSRQWWQQYGVHLNAIGNKLDTMFWCTPKHEQLLLNVAVQHATTLHLVSLNHLVRAR